MSNNSNKFDDKNNKDGLTEDQLKFVLTEVANQLHDHFQDLLESDDSQPFLEDILCTIFEEILEDVDPETDEDLFKDIVSNRVSKHICFLFRGLIFMFFSNEISKQIQPKEEEKQIDAEDQKEPIPLNKKKQQLN